MEKLELIRKIENAFPLMPLPKVLAGERTQYYDEYSYVEDFFLDRQWNAFSMKNLWEVYEGDPSAIPSFMSDEALIYYLPGFLLIIITDYEEVDLLVNSVINTLTVNGNCRLNTINPGFNKRQANAIASFLTYISEEYAGDFEKRGLDESIRFWGNVR